VADLATHLGGVQRWVTELVRTKATSGRAEIENHDPADPQLADWLVGGAGELGAALCQIDPDTPMWTIGRPRTATSWFRRQAQEASVHRWDAQAAVGDPDPIDSDLASEGIGEMLEIFVPGAHRRGGATGSGEMFHFHRTDGPGEWLVRFEPDGATVTTEHAKAPVAMRGPAEDLLLVLWRRRPSSSVEVFGEPAAVERWFELVPAI
jgi:uncharacterized protein (TIGR03083 family)